MGLSEPSVAAELLEKLRLMFWDGFWVVLGWIPLLPQPPKVRMLHNSKPSVGGICQKGFFE